MKRILSILLSVTLVCLLAACGAPAQQGGDAPQADAVPMRALRLGTGSVGGTDNVAIEAMSSVVNRNSDIKTSTVTTTGAVEIINLLDSRELEGGYTGSINLVQALRGEEPFQKEIPASSMLQAFGFVSWRLPVLTVAGSGIESYEDLRGKKMAFPDVGSASTEVLKIVLREAGVLDDVNIEYFTWSDGFSALKDGRVDACVGTWGNGVPPAGIIELLTVRDINILSLPPEVGAKIHEINPGIMAQDLTHAECDIIPEGDPRLSPVNAGVMIFHADVPEESVYEFTRACISNIEELGKITQDLKPLKDYVTSVCVEDVPFHPGAARALKEAGLWDDRFTVYGE